MVAIKISPFISVHPGVWLREEMVDPNPIERHGPRQTFQCVASGHEHAAEWPGRIDGGNWPSGLKKPLDYRLTRFAGCRAPTIWRLRGRIRMTLRLGLLAWRHERFAAALTVGGGAVRPLRLFRTVPHRRKARNWGIDFW
jgi:hypothetical protein